MTINFDEATTKILKNFSTVNDQILFVPGNVLTTVATGKKLVAQAKLNLEVDRTFGIDKLSQLLNTIDLFNDPVIALKDKYLVIRDKNRKVNYTYTEPENVLSVTPEKVQEFRDLMTSSYEFNITAEQLKDILKASSIMSLPDVTFVGDGKVASIRVVNSKDPTSHNYITPIGETDQVFRMVMQAEYLSKLYPSDYTIVLDFKKKFAHFKSPETNIEYWAAMEATKDD